MSVAPVVKMKLKTRRPKSEVVKFIIKEILKNQKVSTQAQLAELANQKLRRSDEGYRLSGRRARLIASQISGIDIHIQTRYGPMPKRCPCCFHSLKKRHTKNLRDRKVIVSLKCSRCNYKGSENRWIPSRYEFEMIR